MKYPTQEEINEIANEFIELRNKAARSRSQKSKDKLSRSQNACLAKLKYLIGSKTYRYKQFSNFQDLEQDGYEALLLALKTYNPKKGNFSWWAEKYIATRISRSANAHSTIRIPIKKARDLKPFKANDFPVMIDESPDACQTTQTIEQKNLIQKAIEQLPELHQKVISMIYGINTREATLSMTTKILNLSQAQVVKILKEAQEKLKQILAASY